MAGQPSLDEAPNEFETPIFPSPRSRNEPGQIAVQATSPTPQTTATGILVLRITGAASPLLAGCGASDRDEAVAAFPPVEHITLPEEPWIARLGTLFNHRDASLANAWRMQLGHAAT